MSGQFYFSITPDELKWVHLVNMFKVSDPDIRLSLLLNLNICLLKVVIKTLEPVPRLVPRCCSVVFVYFTQVFASGVSAIMVDLNIILPLRILVQVSDETFMLE